MSIFLSAEEKSAFETFRRAKTVGNELYLALCQRVDDRTTAPDFLKESIDTDWWYCAAEYLSDAAMRLALGPASPKLTSWLHDVVISLIQRSEDDWIGPTFRDHQSKPARGNLETAHLSWGLAVALDLAGDIFTEAERDEIRSVLRHRAIPLCRRWLDSFHHVANWRCVLGAGVAVPAAVLGEKAEMQQAVREYQLCLQAFQNDGSYGESLQYANYAALHLVLTREALIRRDPQLEPELSAEPWALLPRWQAASLLYRKPLAGWGPAPRARSANFNDSAALFRPSGDLLLHIAARCRDTHPTEAGLARWLFDTLYAPDLAQGPHHSATFGFLNDFGFLAAPLLPKAAAALSPEQAKLPTLYPFSCGDVFVRDKWEGETILALRGGGEPLRGPGHLHGDLNSFILSHKQERLLVDPGHSCYRNLIHGLEGSSKTHNTCTFLLGAKNGLGLQEDKDQRSVLQQSQSARVFFDRKTGALGEPADRGARRLIATQSGQLNVVVSEAATLYGPPLRQFTRVWLLCGARVLFVVDRIVARAPLRVAWHWLFNNRDNALELSRPEVHLAFARRGQAGLKLFHLGHGESCEPENAFVHDAYHPHPATKGEGRPGSGKLLTLTEPSSATQRTVVHAIAMDSFDSVGAWQLQKNAESITLNSPDGNESWTLSHRVDLQHVTVTALHANQSWSLTGGSHWSLQAKQ